MCGCLLCAPYWGPGPKPRHVPYTGNRTSDPLFPKPALNHYATPARAQSVFLLVRETEKENRPTYKGIGNTPLL